MQRKNRARQRENKYDGSESGHYHFEDFMYASDRLKSPPAALRSVAWFARVRRTIAAFKFSSRPLQMRELVTGTCALCELANALAFVQ